MIHEIIVKKTVHSSLGKSRSGFTLLELSVVIIVIGLIASGILIGKEMIISAELRAQMTQIEQINSAANTFKTKYNCLPGDCANAVSFGLGQSSAPGSDGNGDGVIDDRPVNTGELNEKSNFWVHMANAGLMPEYSPTQINPLIKFKGLSPGFIRVLNRLDYVNINLASSHVYAFAAADSNGSGIYHPSQALILDSKIDDGAPMSGMLQSVGPLEFSSCSMGICTDGDINYSTTGSGSPDACIDDTGSSIRYNVNASAQPAADLRCAALISTQF